LPQHCLTAQAHEHFTTVCFVSSSTLEALFATMRCINWHLHLWFGYL